jgi:hypothetical protein
MEIDKRIEGLESEFKLVRGQLKETLMGVRDFLQSLEVPRWENDIDREVYRETVEEKRETVAPPSQGSRGEEPQAPPPEAAPAPVPPVQHAPIQQAPIQQAPIQQAPVQQQPIQQAPVQQAPPLQETLGEEMAPLQETLGEEIAPLQETLGEEIAPLQETLGEEIASLQETLGEEIAPLQEVDSSLPGATWELSEEPSELSKQLLEPEQPQGTKEKGPHEGSKETKMSEEAQEELTISQTNLLANLIRWVAAVRREMGDELLPALLEAYSVGGYLPPELKECILHLANVVAPQPAKADAANVWGRLILELQGILTGGGTPPHSLGLSWNENGESETKPNGTEAEAEVPQNRPIKLKLALPMGDGMERAYSIVLTPDVDGEGNQGTPLSLAEDS